MRKDGMMVVMTACVTVTGCNGKGVRKMRLLRVVERGCGLTHVLEG